LVCYYKDNGERLLEQEPPVRAYATASLSHERFDDYAKGYTTDGVPVYLWAYGNYRYEVEVKKLNFSDCVVFEGPYEDAVSRFEDRAINGVEMY
jgi:hypothetical protein